MPFFKSSQNPQILFLFQFIQLFSPRRTYFRPISNSSYRFLLPKSLLFKFRNLLQILLLHNLTSKFLLSYFFLFKLYFYLYLFRRFYFLNLRSRSDLLRYQYSGVNWTTIQCLGIFLYISSLRLSSPLSSRPTGNIFFSFLLTNCFPTN